MEEQRKITDRQLEETRVGQRAWVYADIKPVGPINYNSEGMVISMTFTFHNTGRLPARSAAPSFAVHAEDGTEATSWPAIQKAACPEQKPGQIYMMGRAVFPDQPDAFVPRQMTVPWREINATGHEQKLITVAGCIWYLSAGDPKLHHSYFFYRVVDARTAKAGFVSVSPKLGSVPPEDVLILPVELGGFDAD